MVRSKLVGAGLVCDVFDEVEPEPSLQTVQRGAALMLEKEPDWIVGLGGGSALDAAKAMWILYERPDITAEAINPFDELGLRRKARLVAIPTTSGTGSETTWAVVLTDSGEQRKISTGAPECTPDIAIVDPIFAAQMPPRLTADTGLDALTHAIEGYTATLASPLTDALHLKAILLLGGNLLRAYRDGSDLEARRNVMMASMIAGVGFPNSGLGSVHGLSLPLGGRFGIPHGVANAIMLPHVMSFNLEARPQKFADIAAALGAPGRGPDAAVEAVLALRRELGIPLLSSFHLKEQDLPGLARDALGRNSNCVTNPRPTREQDAVRIYQLALQEAR
jgi:alcohol dehydrogenase class IV